MRILILAHPRSGSTYIQKLLAHKFKLQNWGELQGPPGVTRTSRMPVDEYYVHDDYVVKVLSVHLFHKVYNWSNFNWNIMDEVVITDRSENTTDQICSWMAMYTNITKPTLLDINSEYLKYTLDCLKIFYEYKTYLLNTFSNVKIIPYELTQKLPEEYIGQLNSITNFDISLDDCYAVSDCKKILANKKDYRTLVLNYDEVTSVINDTLSKYGE